MKHGIQDEVPTYAGVSGPVGALAHLLEVEHRWHY